MDPQEPIHGVIGVDRALGLRVTVRELPLMFSWEATLPTPQTIKKKKNPPKSDCEFLVILSNVEKILKHKSF